MLSHGKEVVSTGNVLFPFSCSAPTLWFPRLRPQAPSLELGRIVQRGNSISGLLDPAPHVKVALKSAPLLSILYSPASATPPGLWARQAGALTKTPWQDFNKKWQNHRRTKEWSCTPWSIFESKINKLSSRFMKNDLKYIQEVVLFVSVQENLVESKWQHFSLKLKLSILFMLW